MKYWHHADVDGIIWQVYVSKLVDVSVRDDSKAVTPTFDIISRILHRTAHAVLFSSFLFSLKLNISLTRLEIDSFLDPKHTISVNRKIRTSYHIFAANGATYARTELPSSNLGSKSHGFTKSQQIVESFRGFQKILAVEFGCPWARSVQLCARGCVGQCMQQSCAAARARQ